MRIDVRRRASKKLPGAACLLSLLVAAVTASPTLADLPADLQGMTVAVVIHSERGSVAYEKAAEIRLEKVLLDNGIIVLDREKAQELKESWGELGNSDYVIVAEDFLRASERYPIDVLIRGHLLTAAHQTLGGYWSATSHASFSVVTSDASVIAAQNSAAFGTPSFPPSDGTSESAATVNAALRAVGDACGRLGFVVLDPTVPSRSSFGLEFLRTINVPSDVSALAVHPNERVCCLGTKSGTVELHSLETSEVMEKKLGREALVWVGFSRDPLAIYALDDAGRAYELGTDFGWMSHSDSGVADAVAGAVSHDGRFLAVVSERGAFALIDMASRKVRRPELGDCRGASAVRLSPDGRHAYVVHAGGCLSIDLRDGDATPRPAELAPTMTGETWSNASLQSAAISPNGQVLALAVLRTDLDLLRNRRTDSVHVELIDVVTEHKFGTLMPAQHVELKPKDITGLAFGPDWRYLAAGSEEGTIRIWNTETGQQEFTLDDAGLGAVRRIGFGDHGSMLVALYDEGRLRAWEAR